LRRRKISVRERIKRGRRHRGSSLLLRSVVLIPTFPPGRLAGLPRESLKLFAGPRAVVVVLAQPLVFVDAKQDERRVGSRVHKARRNCARVFHACNCCSVSSIMVASFKSSYWRLATQATRRNGRMRMARSPQHGRRVGCYSAGWRNVNHISVVPSFDSLCKGADPRLGGWISECRPFFPCCTARKVAPPVGLRYANPGFSRDVR